MDDSPRGSVCRKSIRSGTVQQSRESAGFKGLQSSLPSNNNSALRQQASLSPTTLKKINSITLNDDLPIVAAFEDAESSADEAKPNIFI